MKMQRGFTLVEVMVAVVVLAILASVAIPFYNDYMTRGKLLEATAGLSDGRIRMEQFFQDNRTYNLATRPCPTATRYFTFACSNLSANTYTITATGQGNLAAYIYTINQANVRTSTTPWNPSPNVAVSCWIMRKGDGC